MCKPLGNQHMLKLCDVSWCFERPTGNSTAHTHPTPHDWLHSQKWFRFGLLLVHYRPIDNSLAVVLAFWVVELLRNGEPLRIPCHMSDIWTYRPNHLGIEDVIPNRCFTPSRKAVSIQFHFLESLVRILWKLWNLCTHIRRKASKKTINICSFATPNRNPWRDQPPAEPSLKLPGVTKITVLGLMAPRFFLKNPKCWKSPTWIIFVVLEMFVYLFGKSGYWESTRSVIMLLVDL